MFLWVFFGLFRYKVFGLDPIDAHLRARVKRCMLKCLDDTQIGIGKPCVFAHHRDSKVLVEVVDTLSHGSPIL